nr:acetyltransferase [Providencia stuartii]
MLGVVHGVIPDLGSPAAYRRMKTGAGKEGIAGKVLGSSAKKLMPVLARATAALQLLPSPKYKSPWLKDDDSYPKTVSSDPFTDIYLRNDVWWKLYQSNIIDSKETNVDDNWKSYVKLINEDVRSFMEHQEKGKYHPNTYAFYEHTKPSDGSVKWHITSITSPKDMHDSNKTIPNNYREVPLPFNRSRLYELKASNSAGDGTVPVESLKTIQRQNGQSIKSVLATNVDHQGAYEVKNLDDIHQRPALQFTLRAIAKMVQEVPACW